MLKKTLIILLGSSLFSSCDTDCDINLLQKRYEQANEMMNKKDFAGAVPLFMSIRNCIPSDSVNYQLGCAYLFQFKPELRDSAIFFFESALSLNPNHVSAMSNLASLHIMNGHCNEGLDLLLKLEKVDSNMFGLYNEIANAYDCLKMPEKALAYRSKLISKGIKDPSFLKDRGYNYLQLERFELAIEDYSKVLEEWPNDGESLHKRGIARLGLRDTAAACKDFQKAIELNYQKAQSSFQQYCDK